MVINKTDLAPGIVNYSNIFTESINYINSIEDMSKSNILNWGSAGVLHDQQGKEGVSKKARDTDFIYLPDPNKQEDGILYEFSKNLRNNVLPCLNDYFGQYFVSIEQYEPPQLLRYGSGQHFHEHIDDHPQLTRRVSFSYYINENYTGGEIEFPKFNLKVKPKAFDLLVFPSNYVYLHKVHPVISGLRYVVVQWIR